MIVLPRQARDKHRESTQKRTRFCRNHSVIPNVLLNDCCGLCAAAGPTCAASQWVPAAHPEGTPVPKNKNGTCILKATRDKPINIKSGAAFFPPGVLPPAPVIRSQVWLSLSSTVSRDVCCTCPEPALANRRCSCERTNQKGAPVFPCECTQGGLIVGDWKIITGDSVNMAVFTGPHYPNKTTPEAWGKSGPDKIPVPSFACSSPGVCGNTNLHQCLFQQSIFRINVCPEPVLIILVFRI